MKQHGTPTKNLIMVAQDILDKMVALEIFRVPAMVYHEGKAPEIVYFWRSKEAEQAYEQLASRLSEIQKQIAKEKGEQHGLG